MMLNQTHIDWFSKKQNCVETATYGSEFVATRTETNKLIEMCYMLRMLGIPVFSSSYKFRDNLSVIKSTSIPDDTLKIIHIALSYHGVRKAIAASKLKFVNIGSNQNPANVLSKSLASTKCWSLM